jgi:hypothetical protein
MTINDEYLLRMVRKKKKKTTTTTTITETKKQNLEAKKMSNN